MDAFLAIESNASSCYLRREQNLESSKYQVLKYQK